MRPPADEQQPLHTALRSAQDRNFIRHFVEAAALSGLGPDDDGDDG